MQLPVAIFGAGSLGRLAAAYLAELKMPRFSSFVVDDAFANGADRIAWSALVEDHPPSRVAVFVAVGYRNFRGRASVFNRVCAAGYEVPNIVCTNAHVSSDVSLGRNNFLMPGSVVEPGARLGDNNIVWSNATICHDTVVGNHNFFAANATIGGEARIGDANFFGFSSVVLHQRRIGDDVLVGAQSTVTSVGAHRAVYVGSPARKIRDIDPVVGVRID